MTATVAETWLLDLGNSRAKVARLAGGVPQAILALAWERSDFIEALRRHTATWPDPELLCIASVASEARLERMRVLLAERHPGRVETLRSPRAAAGIVNHYARPERLGVDRFLAMAAAHARTEGPCSVIGCGTALTLDRIATSGDHVDGLIALSPQAMLRALDGATAIAAHNADAFTGGDNDDTARALHGGCWAAAGALVEWFVRRDGSRPAREPVWLHGGWATELAAWLERDGCQVRVLDHAVLLGLALWARGGRVEALDGGG